MIYQTDKLIRDVRKTIDENPEGSSLLREDDSETLNLDRLIYSKIEESAERVLMNASAELLDGARPIGDAIGWHEAAGGYWGVILLPADFMRLGVFKMSDWERSVYIPIDSQSPVYELQHSRYAGIRGNVQKPVVAIVTRPEGKALEFYSCLSDDSRIERGSYYPLPRIDRSEGINIPYRCYGAVVREIAIQTLLSLGETSRAGALSTERHNEED